MAYNNWETDERIIYECFWSIFNDPKLPSKLRKIELFNRGLKEALKHPSSKIMKNKYPDYNWYKKAVNRPGTMLYNKYNRYINDTNDYDSPLEKPFSLSCITDDESHHMKTILNSDFNIVLRSIREFKSLGISPTVREVFWISIISRSKSYPRDSKNLYQSIATPIGIIKDKNLLQLSTTLEFGDIGIFIANEELKSKQTGIDWNSTEIENFIYTFTTISKEKFSKIPLQHRSLRSMKIAYDLNTLFRNPKNKIIVDKDPTGESFLRAGFNVSKLFNEFKDIEKKKFFKKNNIYSYEELYDMNFNAENFYNSLKDRDT